MLGAFSAFAYRHRETEKNLFRGGSSQQFVCFLCLCSLVFVPYGSLNKVLHKISLYEGKIFGAAKEASGIWRIKSNKELNELIKKRNILNRFFFIIFDFFATVHLNIFVLILTNFMH